MKKEKNLYYEKVKKYYWSVYDLNNFELNIGGFENLEDLQAFLEELTNDKINTRSLYNNINFKIPVKERYLIIKDKIEILENLKEF